MTTHPTPTPTQRRPLTPEEVEAHRRAGVKVNNERKRKDYLGALELQHCPVCGATLLLCECPPLGAHVPQYRDVVLTLNVATMRRKVEVR